MRSSIPNLIASDHLLLGLAGILLAVAWLLFYGLSLVRGAKKKSLCVPVLPVTLLWSYDLLFGFLGGSEVHAWWLLWFCLDSLLLWQAFAFGATAYPHRLQRRFATLVTGGTWIAASLVVVTFVSYYELYSGYLIGLMIEGVLAVTLLIHALELPSVRALSLSAHISRFLADILGALETWSTLPFSREFESLELSGGGNNPWSLFLFTLILVSDGALWVLLLRAPVDSEQRYRCRSNLG
jgi:hypothetical protein